MYVYVYIYTHVYIYIYIYIYTLQELRDNRDEIDRELTRVDYITILHYTVGGNYSA